MDAIPFITEMLSVPALRDFLSENVPNDMNNLDLIVVELIKVQILMKSTTFRVLPGNDKQALIEGVRITAHKVGNFMSEIVGYDSKKQCSSTSSHNLVKNWEETLVLIVSIIVASNYLKQTEVEDGMELKDIGAVINSLDDLKRIENMLLEKADTSNCITLNEEKSQTLLLMKAFPAFGEIKESSEMLKFLLELSKELDNLPRLICKACQGQPLAILLIGSLLSLKPMTYDTWNRVKDDLVKIKESDNHMWDIFSYCYDDLPNVLKPCFLYISCYPIGYKIPKTSLTEIWIAEGFVTPEKGETQEETAINYLKQLVQRSLVCISRRSLSSTIKICRVPCNIHKFAIKQSKMDGFLVANPDQEEIKSLFRLAIHHDNEKQYTEVKSNYMHSFLAFNFDRNVLGSAVFLRVLELRNSTIPKIALPNMIYLRYLGLRGSKIAKLPINIGDMENLETLDVRDTCIETLPQSLWNISKLCRVYVKHNPKIEGPPTSTAHPDRLQILKTVTIPKSWQENIPDFLNFLTKFAIINCHNLDWKPISNILSHMEKLISMTIIGKIIPSEFADIRAFPNLETVKTIKLEGIWICRKLFIDNVKFPPNLTKLTLAKSGLKEDPMPTLERLQALKFLSLQDGAYKGKQMVCSAKGFPKLQFLELKKMENLENWEVERGAMEELSKLRVNQCQNNIGNHPNLNHVTDKVIV